MRPTMRTRPHSAISTSAPRRARAAVVRPDVRPQQPCASTALIIFFAMSLILLVPGAGFEPATNGLQNRCSTTELTRHLSSIYGHFSLLYFSRIGHLLPFCYPMPSTDRFFMTALSASSTSAAASVCMFGSTWL